MNLVGLCVAVLSAVGFAVSTSLQHRANEMPGEGTEEQGRLVTLVRRPGWVIGQVIALMAFALHAWALRLAPLLVVQPIVVSGIVLAVPVRAALERRLPVRRELGPVVLTAAALSLFLVASHPSSVRSGHPVMGSALSVTVAAVLAVVCVNWWARGRVGLRRATGYGVASGVLFGLTAGLVKLAAGISASGIGVRAELGAALTAWPTWVVPVVGIAGVVLNQRAYRAGPLSASMPVLNVVDVLVAIAFGLVVFGEVPEHRPVDLAGQGVAIGLMLIGLRRLGRGHTLEASGSAAVVHPI